MKSIPRRQVVLSVTALVFWVLLYTVGLLMESIEQRLMLAPHTLEKQLGVERKPLVDSVKNIKAAGASQSWAFVVAMFCYTPTNMALLTLVAGFLGGCFSNVVVSAMDEAEREQYSARQIAFLAEHPLSATMRGFVIYLCMVAGLYVAMDDPFKDSTPGQYARLAGSLSLVAFIVGYDPTRIEGWLRIAPGPQPPAAPTPK